MNDLFGRTASGLFYRVKGSAPAERDQNPTTCSRVRCSSRMNPVKGNQTQSNKSTAKRRLSLLSTNSREATGSSSQATVSPSLRKYSNQRTKLCFSHDDHDGSNKLLESNVSRESVSKRARSSSSVLSSRHGMKAITMSELGITYSSMVSSTSAASKNSGNGSRIGSGSSRYSCKNLKSKLFSDVKSSSTPSSSSSPSKLIHDRKKIRETESDSRRTGNFSSARGNDVTSATTTRCAARSRLNQQSKPIRVQQTASSSLMSGVSHDTNASTLECTSQRPNSFTNREDARQSNLEVTDEHFFLETNHFRRGLGFQDPHRDMRMDIDNMSYEELLALGERMGSVTTALTEEALAKCLKKSIYESASGEQGTGVGDNGDAIKCSICLEEYKDGDEVGRLSCEHGYHVACIEHWLQLKNWCPFCKASALPSPELQN